MDDGLNLVAGPHPMAGVDLNATRNPVVSAREMLVAEEIDPQRSLLTSGSGMQVKAGHRTV
jgi:hypothetical protein